MSKVAGQISIHHKKCTGCRICEITCSLIKTGAVCRAQSRIQLIRHRQTGAAYHTPTLCMNCCDAPCEKNCPTGATSRDKVTQLIVVDQELCIGCKACVFSCPFGACFIDPVTDRAFRCDQCGGDPACVTSCPENVLVYHCCEEVSGSLKRVRTFMQPVQPSQLCSL